MLSELYAYIQYLCFIGMIRSTYRRVYSVSHSDGKTTTERRTAVRETSIMWGPIQSHDETRRTSQYTMVLRSLRGPWIGSPLCRETAVFSSFSFSSCVRGKPEPLSSTTIKSAKFSKRTFFFSTSRHHRGATEGPLKPSANITAIWYWGVWVGASMRAPLCRRARDVYTISSLLLFMFLEESIFLLFYDAITIDV